MPDDPTTSKTAYEAYVSALALSFPRPWEDLPTAVQAAWDAAAQAVLAWQSAQVPGTAGWLTAHPPPPLTDAERAALDATLEAFSEPEEEEAGGACSRTEENPCETHHLSE